MSQLQWHIPKALLGESIAIMRPHGAKGNEGLALWFGTSEGYRLTITHLVEVVGPGFITTPLYMSLSLRAMVTLTDLAEKIDAILIGQIHSHPERFLDLSHLDKEQGIRSQDYLSVVCPHYAQRDLRGFNDCGVHVFENHHYRRLSSDEVSSRLIAFDSNVSIITCKVPA